MFVIVTIGFWAAEYIRQQLSILITLAFNNKSKEIIMSKTIEFVDVDCLKVGQLKDGAKIMVMCRERNDILTVTWNRLEREFQTYSGLTLDVDDITHWCPLLDQSSSQLKAQEKPLTKLQLKAREKAEADIKAIIAEMNEFEKFKETQEKTINSFIEDLDKKGTALYDKIHKMKGELKGNFAEFVEEATEHTSYFGYNYPDNDLDECEYKANNPVTFEAFQLWIENEDEDYND